MELGLNKAEPQIMHVDLNSAFATIEQQANPLLRGRPIAVAAYPSPGGCILAPSIEAKAYGVKTGMRVRDGKELVKDLIVLSPDPDKYFFINRKLQKLILNYTDDFTPKSIDELVIDFSTSRGLNAQSLTDIGLKIKRDIKLHIGDWMRVNIGIATNNFLAKTAAGLNKPDGLDTITHYDIKNIYHRLGLRDLNGINHRNEARLHWSKIYTPLQFLQASCYTLRHSVFGSIVGYYWYARLRGWEVDSAVFGRKSFGNDYALKSPTANKIELERLIMKLCDKTARRVRKQNYCGYGMSIWLGFSDHTGWHRQMRSSNPLFSTYDMYSHIIRILKLLPYLKTVARMGVACYDLRPQFPEQMSLFFEAFEKQKRLAHATDIIADKFGEFSLVPAKMMNMQDIIIKRVPFGAVSEL